MSTPSELAAQVRKRLEARGTYSGYTVPGYENWLGLNTPVPGADTRPFVRFKESAALAALAELEARADLAENYEHMRDQAERRLAEHETALREMLDALPQSYDFYQRIARRALAATANTQEPTA